MHITRPYMEMSAIKVKCTDYLPFYQHFPNASTVVEIILLQEMYTLRYTLVVMHACIYSGTQWIDKLACVQSFENHITICFACNGHFNSKKKANGTWNI